MKSQNACKPRKDRARSRTDERKNQITPVENAPGMMKKVGS
jgi:hypothetical protein